MSMSNTETVVKEVRTRLWGKQAFRCLLFRYLSKLLWPRGSSPRRRYCGAIRICIPRSLAIQPELTGENPSILERAYTSPIFCRP